MAWYPYAAKKEGNSGGTFTSGPFKGVLHTTEGKTAASAFAAFTKNNSWPHFTVSYEKGYFQVWQHIDTGVASRALRNASGGVQTNRDSAIQIEIVGTCDPRNDWGDQNVERFPWGYLDGLAKLMRWIEANTGVKRQWIGPGIKSYPASYGANNGVRLSQSDWDNGSGWCGHQNVPENLHGDPGLIDIKYLLGAEGVVTPRPQPNPAGTELHLGSRGAEVMDWQKKLNLATGSSLTIDGNFGPNTETATKNFQRFFGLADDGVVGQNTHAVMNYILSLKQGTGSAPAPSKPVTEPIRAGSEAYSRLHPTLQYPNSGDRVEHLQLVIGGLKVDGKFGPATKSRVIAAQKQKRLTPDGVVGPKTWAAIHPTH